MLFFQQGLSRRDIKKYLCKVIVHSPEKPWGEEAVLWGLAFPTKSFKKSISHTSHRFHRQCAASSLSFQAIPPLHFPTGEKKSEKSEEKNVITKTALAPPAQGICCSHCRSVASCYLRWLKDERCTCGVEGRVAMQSTTEFSRAISPQAGGERTVAPLLAKYREMR